MSTNTDKKQSLESTIHGSFILADVEFALPAQVIQEVVNEPEHYDPMPLAPDYALGLLNLRGVIMPVVDIRILFEIEGERTANNCLLYTSPSPRDRTRSRMPSSA